MSKEMNILQDTILKPQITVISAGGAGGNAINNMIRKDLEGVNFVVTNTDAQALEHSVSPNRVQLGRETTKGLGAGASPEVGKYAAEETTDEIVEHLRGSNMAFITAGMGGGTGTGAAPVIARIARDMDILTVAVVTKPFHFEGPKRMRIADLGLEELQKNVDTLLIIPNQNLFRVANERTTFAEAFAMADDVLHAGIRSITDLMVMPGLINLDFADVRAVMTEMGKAMMGTGEADGERRAYEAAEAAISNPLLDNASMKGAKGVLINITGGSDMTLFEVDEAANRIREEVDVNANIIFGSTFDDSLEGCIRVSVVATGIDKELDEDDMPPLEGEVQKTEEQPQDDRQSNRYYSRPGSGFGSPSAAQARQTPESRGVFTRKIDIPSDDNKNQSRPAASNSRRESSNPYRNGMAATDYGRPAEQAPRSNAQDNNPGYDNQADHSGRSSYNPAPQQDTRRESAPQDSGYYNNRPQPQTPQQPTGGYYGASQPQQPAAYEPRQSYAPAPAQQDNRESFYNEQDFRRQPGKARDEGEQANSGIFGKVAKMARSLQHPKDDENGQRVAEPQHYNEAQEAANRQPDRAPQAQQPAAPQPMNYATVQQPSRKPVQGRPEPRQERAYQVEQPAPANKDNRPAPASQQEKGKQASGSLFDQKNEDQAVSEVPAFMRKKTHEPA